jgi:hypothetical protein
MIAEEILKPCPLCGKSVRVALCGDYERQWYTITRGMGKEGCKCRIFFESRSFDPEIADEETKKLVKLQMIDDWNKRAK